MMIVDVAAAENCSEIFEKLEDILLNRVGIILQSLYVGKTLFLYLCLTHRAPSMGAYRNSS